MRAFLLPGSSWELVLRTREWDGKWGGVRRPVAAAFKSLCYDDLGRTKGSAILAIIRSNIESLH
jgi:hypothetical protein